MDLKKATKNELKKKLNRLVKNGHGKSRIVSYIKHQLKRRED